MPNMNNTTTTTLDSVLLTQIATSRIADPTNCGERSPILTLYYPRQEKYLVAYTGCLILTDANGIIERRRSAYATNCGRIGLRHDGRYYEVPNDRVAAINVALTNRTLYSPPAALTCLPAEHLANAIRVAQRTRTETSSRREAQSMVVDAAFVQASFDGVAQYHASRMFGWTYSGICLGLELEVWHNDGAESHRELVRIVNASGFTTEDLSLERDSTVTAEIVFRAVPMEKWIENMPRLTALCSALSAAGFVSERGGYCGGHIHVTAQSSAHKHQAFDRVYENLDFFMSASRRRRFDWCAFDRAPGGHRTAVNLHNVHTIEYRFWRGTLNVDTILARLAMSQSVTYTEGNLDEIKAAAVELVPAEYRATVTSEIARMTR